MQQISRDKFDRFLRATTDFTLCVLDRHGLRDHWPARPTLTPPIRFLYIGSRICSTLPSDPASRRRPCASLSLLLYQDVKRTFTSKLSIMLGVPKERERPRPLPYGLVRGRAITCQPQRRLDRGWTPLSWHQTHRKRRSVHSCPIPGRHKHS